MRFFKKLRCKLSYFDESQIALIYQAYLFACRAHAGQKRCNGDPYITHPVAVAWILAELRLDHQTIMAALLHDVIEDTPFEKDKISERFGSAVAVLVDGVSKLTQIEFVSRAEAQAENFRKMVMAMAHDIRVIIVKLADRLHNMRTLSSLRTFKRRRIARETLEIFAPIAKRLGMRAFSAELEELGFAALNPIRYKILKEAVRKARGNRKKILSLIEKRLHHGLKLKKSALPSCIILGREKNLYSIYRKMRNKHIPFNEIMDVYAFRIVVDKVDTCYRALGLVHSLFKPVSERFKDYIAIPKVNGYQSLHTTLFSPYGGFPIEVQIRTKDMDKMASEGIAAHWLYKSGDNRMSQSQLRAQKWVKNLLELQQEAGNSLEFIESVKVDLFPDEVYVFTPQGDIMEFPAGSTAVDFAYAVHTDIGNSCVSVKIDRQCSPLSTKLVNGQSIEVICSSNKGRPNPAWLDFVLTSKARNAIRHFLKNQKRAESISLGKQLLKKTLANYSLSLKKLPQPVIHFILQEIHLKNLDDLLEEIGLGNRIGALVAQRIASITQKLSENHLETDANMDMDTTPPLIIKGTEGMLMNFSTCCHPIPGDPIIGNLDAGKGIAIHVEDCPRMAKLRRHTDHCILLRWADNITHEFLVKIHIQVINERGVLAILALAISDADGNVEDIMVKDQDGHHYMVRFTLLVRNRLHLGCIIRKLRNVKQVVKIIPRLSGDSC